MDGMDVGQPQISDRMGYIFGQNVLHAAKYIINNRQNTRTHRSAI